MSTSYINAESLSGTDASAFEKRSGGDRRKRKTPIFSRYWLTGRRSRVRREMDRCGPSHIERHGPKTLAAIMLILLFSVLDAFFTLDLLSHGGAELNPIMAYYLSHGPLVFFVVKYLLTCASIILILFYKDSYILKTRVRVKALFILGIICFALVVQWELYLMFYGS